MLISRQIMNSTTSFSISQLCAQAKDFDFDMEETDWTWDQVDENTGSAKQIKEIWAHQSRFENQAFGNSESIDSFSETFVDPSLSFDLHDFIDSSWLTIKYEGHEFNQLAPISEWPSCDEFSAYEDSWNWLSTLGWDTSFLENKKANTVKSDSVKTLGEVQLKFKTTEWSLVSNSSSNR